ncbi:hypothetical protein DAPPUDRAFT_95306 [Daphnia pulex]|uniref:Uncharacterized protein n=1 Tax=Daphnia pulex TaxID=6669 RepID=E9FVA6_DAPPU|nr:hypothetical protein DAPPUDRAFT_95306 [Daphnia pulex]|eukprot:EFX88528.1 hypothetical protein DAPPUDRAFT_95306 [Daphnia pulex]
MRRLPRVGNGNNRGYRIINGGLLSSLERLGKLGERLNLFAVASASIEAGGAFACSCQNGSVSGSRRGDAGGCSEGNQETTTSDAFWGVESGLNDEGDHGGSRTRLAFSNIFNWGDGFNGGFTKK